MLKTIWDYRQCIGCATKGTKMIQSTEWRRLSIRNGMKCWSCFRRLPGPRAGAGTTLSFCTSQLQEYTLPLFIGYAIGTIMNRLTLYCKLSKLIHLKMKRLWRQQANKIWHLLMLLELINLTERLFRFYSISKRITALSNKFLMENQFQPAGK